ncbi:hypothetical protein N7E81_14080 [Reichenbachiella carrageenanivorans]|uniref:AsmA-like C-terminal region n=1 Tax=Reichenbachiella carrageenanivorans TaxID=2979869 RepID=A0ABY6CX43_9BACT|nr:hypothetical protein [Reichenbachiella carrageenanivorans]UXX78486.1 hypothetical protein N7E81_14080 [Reichenbachiella carrageenanivorans]
MKILLKAVKITLLVFLIAFTTLIVAGWLMQEKITKLAVAYLSETLGSPMATGEISFSLIENFPQASVRVDGIWVGARQEQVSDPIDTLAKINKLYINLKSTDLLDNVFTIKNLSLEDGYVKYLVDSTGATCFDFLMPSDTTSTPENEVESAPLLLTVDKVTIRNITTLYSDDQLKVKMKAYLPVITCAVDIDELDTRVLANGQVKLSNMSYDNTHLNRMKGADIQFDVAYRSDSVIAKTLKIATDEIDFSAKGKIALTDMYTDLTLSISVPELAALIKYAPEDLLNEYKVSQLSGGIELQTKVKGMATGDDLPHYEVKYKLTEASIKYDTLPLAYNIILKGSATNGAKSNNSTTAILVDLFAIDFSGNHIETSGNFNNLDQLNYNLKTKISLDLLASKPLIPRDLVQQLSGRVQASIQTQGTLPDSIDNKFIEQALQNTRAQIQISDLDLIMDSVVTLNKLSTSIDYKARTIKLKNLSTNLPDYKVNLLDNSIHVRLIGDVMNVERLDLDIPSFYLATDEGSVFGSAYVGKMEDVSFAIQSNIDVELANLKRLAPDTLVNDMKGRFQAKIRTRGEICLDSVATQFENILYDQTTIDLRMKNITLDMTDTLMNVQNLNGHIAVDSRMISISNFGGMYQKMAFNIDTTTIQNLFNTVIRNRPGTLKVDGICSLGDLDYTVLGAFASSEDTPDIEAEEPASEPQAWNYEIKGKLSVNSFKYENSLVKDIQTTYDIQDVKKVIKAQVSVGHVNYEGTLLNGLSTNCEMNTATNEIKGKLAIDNVKYEDALLEQISALYNVNDTVYTVDQLKFLAFGGKVNTAIKVKMDETDHMEIEMKNSVSNIDIRRLMKEMKNFDQQEMTYQQLNGKLSSDNFFLRMTMIGDSIVYDDLRMTCDLKFEDGGIYQYPPVQDMAQYLPKIDNLDTMSFKTINTHMFLFKDAVYVPRTYVVTSVFDVEAIGMQSFGEDYQYHIGINLGQILGKNKQSSLDENAPTKRKKMIRLKATGRKGKYKSGFDKEKDRDAMLTKVKTQEKILEFRFQPKFFTFDTGAEKL